MASVQALGSFLCCIFKFQLGLRENLLAQIQFKSDYHHLAVSDTTPNSGPKTDNETETHIPPPSPSPSPKCFQVQDQVRVQTPISLARHFVALDKGHG